MLILAATERPSTYRNKAYSKGNKCFPGERTLQPPSAGRGEGGRAGSPLAQDSARGWGHSGPLAGILVPLGGTGYGDPVSQNSRFSGFQVFTRTAAPEILPTVLGWDGDGECPEKDKTSKRSLKCNY